jgi:hypothetical protein
VPSRYWSITRSVTGNFDPSVNPGDSVINPTHWEADQTLDLYVPIVNISWYSSTNAAAIDLSLVAMAPEAGSALVNRISLFLDASGFRSAFDYTNYGEGRRVPFVGSRGQRYSLQLLTRGNIGVATWTVEVWWRVAGSDTACPPQERGAEWLR